MNNGLILEIGGGHNPDFRSDVIVDKYLYDNIQRKGTLRVDRPIIVADGEQLPFSDGAFKFTIGKQVMEHVENIEEFFHELMRISHAGYLTSPSTLSEYLFWWPYHNWFITMKDNTLYCCKKTNEKSLFGDLMHYLYKNNYRFKQFIWSLPAHVLNIEYYWKGKINYVIVEKPILPDLSNEHLIALYLSNSNSNTLGQKVKHYINMYCPGFPLCL